MDEYPTVDNQKDKKRENKVRSPGFEPGSLVTYLPDMSGWILGNESAEPLH